MKPIKKASASKCKKMIRKIKKTIRKHQACDGDDDCEERHQNTLLKLVKKSRQLECRNVIKLFHD